MSMTPQSEIVLIGKMVNIEQCLLRIAVAVEAIAKSANSDFKTQAEKAEATKHIAGTGRGRGQR
jgi:hypothetical protein